MVDYVALAGPEGAQFVGQAAGLLGVSDDALHLWPDRRRVETTTDHLGRMAANGAALADLAEQVKAVTGIR